MKALPINLNTAASDFIQKHLCAQRRFHAAA